MNHHVRRILVSSVLLVCAAAAQAQQKPNIIAFGSDSPDRGTTRVGYWNRAKNHGAGQFAIDHGRPAWKKDYEDTAKFDAMTKGKVWRLGDNFWTTFDTDMPLTISGKTVPAGSWYLGVERSADGGQWNLVFIDPVKARAGHIDASEIGRAPIDFKAPLTLEQVTDVKDKVTIDLTYKAPNIQDVTLRIGWGKLQLSAPIKVPSME
ncbi:MAG TPA: DUF2911 domain-containing protein [Blastocatellia bacterium]|nr:DUF2911 domain-containing protein [Blastocatellia bacterium]